MTRESHGLFLLVSGNNFSECRWNYFKFYCIIDKESLGLSSLNVLGLVINCVVIFNHLELLYRFSFHEFFGNLCTSGWAATTEYAIQGVIKAASSFCHGCMHFLVVTDFVLLGLLDAEELFSNDHLLEANEVFIEGLEGGLQGTNELFDRIVEADCKAGDHENAVSILRVMEYGGRMSTTFHYNCLLMAQVTCSFAVTIPSMQCVFYLCWSRSSGQVKYHQRLNLNCCLDHTCSLDCISTFVSVAYVFGVSVNLGARLVQMCRTS
jgi:hypothetical protein